MKKQETITFKVDSTLSAALQQVANRSEFIRHAVLEALNNVCPLCQGSGILSASQKKHWQDFTRHHSLERCSECEDLFLTCDRNL